MIPPCPDPFLEVRVSRADVEPPLTAVCAGYELKEWRCTQLVTHLTHWLPEFALTHSEREALGAHNAVPLTVQAAKALYQSDKYQKRGEFGELLLHAITRQVFGSIPAISKYYFKDATNDTVKGFDCVHVIASPTCLELWLGEVKFYADINLAIRDVVAELSAHTTRDYLRSEFTAITHKIDPAWPHAARLQQLIHPNVSLDVIFDAICIPVLLTYDSDIVGSHDVVSDEFKAALAMEVTSHRDKFASKELPMNVRIHLILFPLKSKADLVKRFDERLKQWQALG